MQEPTIALTTPAEAIAAYHEIEARLREIPSNELLPLPPDLDNALNKALTISTSADGDRKRFEAVYRTPPLGEIESVRKNVLAVRGAMLVSRDGVGARSPDLERAKQLRARHVSLLRAIFFGDETMETLLTQTVLGPQPAQSGNALSALAALERQHWPLISATGLISAAEVSELRRLSERISRSSRTFSQDPARRTWTSVARSCRILRNHAYLIHCDDLAEWELRYPRLELDS